MINKDTLIQYVRIISGCDADPNLTLVDFSLDDEKRNIVNLVNEEAKKDKKLANLLENLKYSNNKTSIIEEYFSTKENIESKIVSNSSENTVQRIPNVRIYNQERANSYGFINMTSLASIIGIVTVILTLVITFGTK